MFRCEDCGKVTQPREPQALVVVETRRRLYHDGDGNEIGFGNEIVKEKKLCPACAPRPSVSTSSAALPRL